VSFSHCVPQRGWMKHQQAVAPPVAALLVSYRPLARGISRALETLVLVPAHVFYGMPSYRPRRNSREAADVGVPTKRA
jgi:hypothetical protein